MFAEEQYSEYRDQNDAQFIYRRDACGVSNLQSAKITDPRRACGDSRKREKKISAERDTP
jgi:hypothetical protein